MKTNENIIIIDNTKQQFLKQHGRQNYMISKQKRKLNININKIREAINNKRKLKKLDTYA